MWTKSETTGKSPKRANDMGDRIFEMTEEQQGGPMLKTEK